ncbi:peptidylprolyl isomerase [Peribacillus alkalitolerans]|uniref:peptidylprolyl isomerase n=1 Tax=Peribacillus alkalitolerans TaxID=1550385 RepID=UPI0013D2FA87|nr:peptidylprolyl isomerase [Peribacillus alkalitolerans]
MKKWALSLALTASIVGLTACNNADSGNSEVVVKTKAGEISQDELYQALKERYGNQVLQELVYEKVLSDKYKVTDKELNEKVDKLKKDLGDNFEMALAQYGYKNEEDLKRSFKIGMLQEKAAIKDIKVTEKEMKEYYENIKPEIHARHILVDDEKTAQEVKKKLDTGAKFEDLAKEYSKDPGSAEKGGDLGWFGTGTMVAPFETAAYALEKNEISDVVKTEHGFHIIQLLDKKEKKSFEDMKKEIEYEIKISKLDSEKVQKVMDLELKDADVEIKDKDLKDALKAPAADAQ